MHTPPCIGTVHFLTSWDWVLQSYQDCGVLRARRVSVVERGRQWQSTAGAFRDVSAATLWECLDGMLY